MFTPYSPTELHALVPAGAATGPITVMTPGGAVMTATNFAVQSPTAVTVSITTPATGTSLSGDQVIVQGTVTGDGELGVLVNGVPAAVSGSRWLAEVPIGLQTTLLTATAFNDAGSTATATVSVTVLDTPSAALAFSALPASGVAPLTVTWRVENRTGRSLVQFELDAAGSGTFAAPVSAFDGTQSTYTAAGLIRPVLRATDDQGTTYTATTTVNILPRDQLDAALQTKWASMKTALAQKDVEGALAFYVPAERERYWTIFTSLRNDLPQIVQDMGNLQLIFLIEDRAKYRLLRTELYGGQSVTFTYFVYFIRDLSGAWRIEGF